MTHPARHAHWLPPPCAPYTQLVNPDQFVGLLVSSILAAQHPPTREAGEQHAAAAGSAAHAAGVEPGGVAALEAEMRALQLQLQQQADALEGAAAAALAQQQERAWEAYSYGAQEGAGAQDEWQEASPRPRRHQQQQQQQPSPSPLQQGASGDTAGEQPNKGLWVGWISREAQEEGVRRAFSRWVRLPACPICCPPCSLSTARAWSWNPAGCCAL